MKDTYETLLNQDIDLRELPDGQRKIAQKLFRKFRKNPDWNEFGRYYMKLCKPIFDALPRKRVPETPLYLIAQDLEMRLGIDQGRTRMPDYRDMLEYLIRREYRSIAEFCKQAGVDQAYLSNLFAKNRNASIERLDAILDKLGYQIKFARKQALLGV